MQSTINSQPSTRYVIVTPAKNEADCLQQTIDSVAAQTLPPRKWAVVNDSSTDQTGRIIDKAAERHSWIVPVHRSQAGPKKPGRPHIEAFYQGYTAIKEEPWDYL